MRKLAVVLTTLALGCADPGPLEPIPLAASLLCDLGAISAEGCPQATGSITLEVRVVTVTRGP